eukprot:TRINITY_DN9138_c0_g1_i2.p1 TRINITY_DN9138_c0_g1~~TRINITY_DN9138_c0_g1_i2.p1  ORF type:complete len:563 (+),score=90.03 TRINITY_DN9138_c0_g1_i2:339-2027(+)
MASAHLVTCVALLSASVYSIRSFRSDAYDTVVYGATPGGIAAAIAAQQMLEKGSSVVVITPWTHVGGMLSAGMVDDSIQGQTQAYGGLAAELFRRIAAFYGQSNTSRCGCFQANPNVTEMVFLTWMKEQGIEIVLNASIVDASMSNGIVLRIRLSNGQTITGRYFIDGTYEGDLLAAIDHPYAVGMEANTTYNESLAGQGLCESPRSTTWQEFKAAVNPFDANGQLLPHVTANGVHYGMASDTIQSYNLRACLTTKSNGIAIPPPSSYNASEWQLLDRYIQAMQASSIAIDSKSFFGCAALEGGCDTNDGPAVSINPMGEETWNWPVANHTTRLEYRRHFVNYFLGLFHHLQQSPHVSSKVKQQLARYRLCPDTWQDIGNLPFIPYVREGRRMVGDVIFTQGDWAYRTGAPLPVGQLGYSNASAWYNTSVGLSFWFIDAHASQAVAVGNRARNAGCLQYGRSLMDAGAVAALPLGLIVPQAKIVGNLAIVNAVSASHVGYQPVRVEPTFMVLGEAAGVLVAMARNNNTSIHSVDADALTDALRGRGCVLERGDMHKPIENCC